MRKFTALSVILFLVFLITAPSVKATTSWIWSTASTSQKTVLQTANYSSIPNQTIQIPQYTHTVSITLTTQKVTPTPTAKPTPTPGPSVSLSDEQKFMMNAINNYRKSLGLSSVTSDKYTCAFAATRAQEITSGFNHDGFNNRVSSHTLPYPSYHEVTENIAETSNYQDVVTMWINSPGHAENMRRDTPNVCVVKNGNYYAYEGWKP